MAPTTYTTNGTPADTLGVEGDMAIDYGNKFLWGPKKPTTWTGTASSIVGPTGPPGAAPVLPQMVNVNPAWGPAAQFANTTVGVSNTPMTFCGSSIPYTFTPTTDTALTGLAVSNYSPSGATIYFYMVDLTTGQTVFNYNAGNGIANNSTSSVAFGNTAYKLLAGHTYQWQAQRVTAAATTLVVFPQYLVPSGTPSSISVYTQGVISTSTTVAKTGKINFNVPGINTTDGLQYRNSNSSYLYMLEVYISGSGVSDIFIQNQTAGTNQFTQDNYGYTTLTSTLTRYTFGPFSPTTWPFLPNNQYYIATYAINGSLTVTQAVVNLYIGQ